MDDLVLFVAVGFAAQIVDGALGMAYGVSATTVLLSFGVMPAVASASRASRSARSTRPSSSSPR
jgi:uncharacterized membrane protein YfcA